MKVAKQGGVFLDPSTLGGWAKEPWNHSKSLVLLVWTLVRFPGFDECRVGFHENQTHLGAQTGTSVQSH